MVKMNCCCCTSLGLLTCGERKYGGPDNTEENTMECKFPTMMDNSWNNFLAVNTDSVMKDEPGSYLASVDASSSPLALIIPRYF